MPLFKVTVKRPFLDKGGQHFEAGMSAEVPYNGNFFPWTNSKVKAEIQRQFKVKYNMEISMGLIGSGYFNVEEYPWR